jgi:hypothetical protein
MTKAIESSATQFSPPLGKPGDKRRRAAFFVGNNHYFPWLRSLKNAENDAITMALVFKDLQFEIDCRLNLDREGFDALLRDVTKIAPECAIIVIYYSGHGLSFNDDARSTNYAIPSGMRLPLGNMRLAQDHVRHHSVNLLSLVQASSAAIRSVIFFDACREIPSMKSMSEPTAEGQDLFEKMSEAGSRRLDYRGDNSSQSNMLIAFAADHGHLASDDGPYNGPYASALAAHLYKRQDLRTILPDVLSDFKRSNHKQRPTYQDDCDSPISLAPEDVVRPTLVTDLPRSERLIHELRTVGSSSLVENFLRSQRDDDLKARAEELLRDIQAGVLVPRMVDMPDRLLMRLRSIGPAGRYASVTTVSVARCPITVEEWNSLAGGGGVPRLSFPASTEASSPVVGVSWIQARQYAAALSRATSRRFQLPTEVEWELFCHGDSAGEYWVVPPINARQAWFRDSFGADIVAKPMVVGTLPPNDFGLCDMVGNVWEWCEAPKPNIAGNAEARTGQQITKGGCYASVEAALKTRERKWCPEKEGRQFIGFRVLELR